MDFYKLLISVDYVYRKQINITLNFSDLVNHQTSIHLINPYISKKCSCRNNGKREVHLMLTKTLFPKLTCREDKPFKNVTRVHQEHKICIK